MNNEPKTITIPISEYERLKDSELFLDCLNTAGVDNWEGYEEACDIFKEEKEHQ